MNLYKLLRPVLYQMPPETAHRLVTGCMEFVQNTPIQSFLQRRYTIQSPRLSVKLWDHEFPNPVGLAAGFDKEGRLPAISRALGFGFTEIGGVTGEAQSGNPRPRMFRLESDKALINRMGFNNPGAEAVASHLDELKLPDCPLGINMGKSKSVELSNAPEDYLFTFRNLQEFGDFFVVNVSSPNTPGLRSLQDRGPLEDILGQLKEAQADPLLVKVSPDLTESALEDVLDVAQEMNLDGIIATNTTTNRPDSLNSPNRGEEGGLSGKPLNDTSTDVIQFIANRSELPIIGVGGIFTAEDAYQKIKNGASLVQLYTGLVYEGPSIARSINENLLDKLDRDGFDTVQEAVGAEL